MLESPEEWARHLARVNGLDKLAEMVLAYETDPSVRHDAAALAKAGREYLDEVCGPKKIATVLVGKFGGHLMASRYATNLQRTALMLVSDAGEPLLKVSVNLPDEELEDDEVVVDANSPNGLALKVMKSQDVYEPTGRILHSGFVDDYQVWKLKAVSQ